MAKKSLFGKALGYLDAPDRAIKWGATRVAAPVGAAFSIFGNPKPAGVQNESQYINPASRFSSAPSRSTQPAAPVAAPSDQFNLPGADLYGGGYGGGSGGSYGGSAGAAAPDTNAIRAQVMDRYGILNRNYDVAQQEANADFGQLEGSVNNQRGQFENRYAAERKSLDETKDQTDRSRAMLYAGRGIGDSTYFGDAQGQANNEYSRQVEMMSQDRMNKLQDLDGRLNEARRALAIQRRSLDINSFNSLEEFQGALQQIEQYDAGIESQRQRVKQSLMGIQAQLSQVSPEYSSAQANQQVLGEINRMIAAGTSKKQIRGYISQFGKGSKGEIDQLLDYYLRAGMNNPEE